MNPWLIAPLVILGGLTIVATLVKWVWFFRIRRQRHLQDTAPLTMKWRDEHAYRKDGK